MTEDQYQKLQQSLDELKRGVFGDERIGHAGLVATQQDHGRRISKIERACIYLGGAAGVITVMWTIYAQWPRK